MINVYTGKLLELPLIEVLYPNFGKKETPNLFGEVLFKDLIHPLMNVVENPADADFLFIPHNYGYVKNNKKYINHFRELSQKFSKKIIIFVLGDSDELLPIPHTIIFRHSQYRYKKLPNEIILPAYAADLGGYYGIVKRTKGREPVVGFCGWAEAPSVKSIIKFTINDVFLKLKSLIDYHAYAHRKGLFFRKQAINILKKASGMSTHFVIRKTYGGNTKTISLDPQKSRKEYINTLIQSDVALCVKGDGNFSVRFFEALSLGRIPLLVDTECVLPLEEKINYDSFVIRIDHKNILTLPEVLKSFYAHITNDQFIEMQKQARNYFETYLRIDVFLKHVFTEAFLNNIQES